MIRAYLDNNATTKPAAAVLEAMLPFLGDIYLNPSSAAGELLGATRVFRTALRAVAGLAGDAELADRFVLTSGASEANSWAVAGALETFGAGHLVTTAIEHPSILKALQAARPRGFELSVVNPDSDGVVRPEMLEAVLRDDTRYVSIMLANNETGAIQPLAELAQRIRARAPRAVIHTDATQAFGRIPLDLADTHSSVDLLSMSAHKFHGPKGVGALFVREGVQLRALIHGEQQEGMRGGTLNAAAAAGLGAAAALAARRLDAFQKVALLRDRFESRLIAGLPGAWINGLAAERLANTSSITIPGVRAAELVDELALRGVCISMGSACSAGSLAPSHVLLAMGLSHDDALSTIRVSLCVDTTDEELEVAIGSILEIVSAKVQGDPEFTQYPVPLGATRDSKVRDSRIGHGGLRKAPAA